MALGYPLYVNGREVRGPVTISHRPTAGLGRPYRPGFGSTALNPLVRLRPGFGATETDDVKERSLMPEEETALLASGGALQTGDGKHYLVWRRDGRSPTDVAAEDSRKLTYLAIGAAVVAGVAGYLVGRRR